MAALVTRTRWLRRGLWGTGVVVVTAVVLLVALQTGRTKTPTQGVLPVANRIEDSVPVGYPHTTPGAVSAAAHFVGAWNMFDPAGVERTARVAAEPDYRLVISAYARRMAVEICAANGLPSTGATNGDSYDRFQARAYQLSAASRNKVTVWLLADETESVQSKVSRHTEVRGAVMLWVAGDWRLGFDTFNGGLPAPPAPVRPDTVAARSQGWSPLAYMAD